MFYRMLQRANFLLTEYCIFDFPVPLQIIEEIITNHKYKLVILKNLKGGSIIADTIYLPSSDSACIRENMIHECGHALNHCHNQCLSDIIQISKNEAQANAFAAYFLMPVFIFEEALKYCSNDFELSKEFGVHPRFIQYRKTLTQGLININYFNRFNDIGDEINELSTICSDIL